MSNSKSQREWSVYLFKQPQKLRAGSMEGRELYFPCSDCEAKEPDITGYLGYGLRYEDVLVKEKAGTRCLAFVCASCMNKYMEEGVENEKT